jgi:hypothetical protein
MKTVTDLKREFDAIKSKKIPRLEKLTLVRQIRGGIGDRGGRRL